MNPILVWLVVYALLCGAAVYVNSGQHSQRIRILTMHTFVLLSVLLMSVIGVRLEWSLGALYVAALLVALLLSAYLVGPAAGFGYTISSAIQETCLLLAAMLLAPAVGIVASAVATSLVYTFAHKAHPTEGRPWRWKYPVIFLYGVGSIFLYAWLHQPLLNIAIHTVAGSVLIYYGFLYTLRRR